MGKNKDSGFQSGNTARCKRWREKKRKDAPDYFRNARKKRKVVKFPEIPENPPLQNLNYTDAFDTQGEGDEENQLKNDHYEEEEEEEEDELPDGYFYCRKTHPVFKTPFTMVVGGPTGSGKSTFVEKLLQRRADMFFPEVDEIWWYHCQPQPHHEVLRRKFPGIVIREGVPDIRHFDDDMLTGKMKNRVVVLDDMMQELCDNGATLAALFTKISHHRSCSIILITQNIFARNKDFRTAGVNAQHMVVMKNPRDINQITSLQTQMFGPKSSPKTGNFLQSVYKFVTRKPHSYLLIMSDQYTPPELRVRSHIFPGQGNFVYL